MSYTLEQMQQAADLFAKLWQDGEVDLEDETGLLYHEKTVREILEDVYERRWGVKILHAPESLILVPAVGNSLFGYTHAELREKLGRNLRERDLYLAYFVILILLSCFYDGETSTQTHRAFVPVSELYGRVKNHMAEIRDMVEDDAIAASHTFDLDFCSMAEVWYERSDDLETLVHPEKSNSRLGFVLKVMMFLQDEGLVHVLDREEVRLTEKCRQIVFRYYFNAQRKEVLMRLLHQPNGKEPSEHAGS